MKNKKLIVLAIVTLAVILAAGIASRLRAPQSTINTQVLFPELAGRINDIAAITIKGNKGTIVLQQQGERWVLASADNYPALFNRIKQNVVGMSELRIVDEKMKLLARLTGDKGTSRGAGPGSNFDLARLSFQVPMNGLSAAQRPAAMPSIATTGMIFLRDISFLLFTTRMLAGT